MVMAVCVTSETGTGGHRGITRSSLLSSTGSEGYMAVFRRGRGTAATAVEKSKIGSNVAEKNRILCIRWVKRWSEVGVE